MAEMRSQTSVKLKIIVLKKSNTSSLACGICSMSFKHKKDLNDHKRSHPAARPVACKKCGKRFLRDKHLGLHLSMVHGPKVFICEQGCGKTFVRKSDLVQHSILHDTDKPYRCRECGKRFKTKRFCKTHYNVHRTEATFVPASEVIGKQQKETSDSESDEEHTNLKKIRVFTCDICNKHFRSGFNLRRHCASHLNKIFTCVECKPEVQFKDIASREKHYADSHSGKPFKCTICFRLFKTKGNKDRHVLTHSNKSVYVVDN